MFLFMLSACLFDILGYDDDDVDAAYLLCLTMLRAFSVVLLDSYLLSRSSVIHTHHILPFLSRVCKKCPDWRMSNKAI